MPRPTSHRKPRIQFTCYILHRNDFRENEWCFSFNVWMSCPPPPLLSSVMYVWVRWWTTCSLWWCEPPPRTSPARTPSATSPTGGSSSPGWSIRELHHCRLPAPAVDYLWPAEQLPSRQSTKWQWCAWDVAVIWMVTCVWYEFVDFFFLKMEHFEWTAVLQEEASLL